MEGENNIVENLSSGNNVSNSATIILERNATSVASSESGQQSQSRETILSSGEILQETNDSCSIIDFNATNNVSQDLSTSNNPTDQNVESSLPRCPNCNCGRKRKASDDQEGASEQNEVTQEHGQCQWQFTPAAQASTEMRNTTGSYRRIDRSRKRSRNVVRSTLASDDVLFAGNTGTAFGNWLERINRSQQIYHSLPEPRTWTRVPAFGSESSNPSNQAPIRIEDPPVPVISARTSSSPSTRSQPISISGQVISHPNEAENSNVSSGLAFQETPLLIRRDDMSNSSELMVGSSSNTSQQHNANDPRTNLIAQALEERSQPMLQENDVPSNIYIPVPGQNSIVRRQEIRNPAVLIHLREQIENENVRVILEGLNQRKYESFDESNVGIEEEICSICLDKMEKGQDVVRLDCGHDHYHFGCIKRWLVVKNCCPICMKIAIPSDQEQSMQFNLI